ncbi:MAG: hypothetical protein WCH34_15520 [Bacteroidota bacterium]
MSTIENDIRQLIRHTLSDLLTLEDFPQKNIESFCNNFIEMASYPPISPFYQSMIDLLNPRLAAYKLLVRNTNLDRGERHTDILDIKDKKQYIIDKLTEYETKVMTLTGNNVNIVNELHLNTKSHFYSGSLITIMETYDELLLGVTRKPDLSTILTSVTDFVNEIKAMYQTKSDKFRDIKQDVSNKTDDVSDLRTVLLSIFFQTCNENIADLSKIEKYFDAQLLDGITRGADFLYENEYLFEISAGSIINAANVKFNFSSVFKIENLSTGVAAIFLSNTPNPTVVPNYASIIVGGQTSRVEVQNIGTHAQYNLIISAKDSLENVKIKITVV